MSLSIGREINGKVIYALLANAIHPLADPEEIRIIPGKTVQILKASNGARTCPPPPTDYLNNFELSSV